MKTVSSAQSSRKKSRKAPARPHVARHRPNTSAIVMMPYEVAEQLMVSEREIYTLMALGAERGGIRAICLGNPSSARPRKLVHREDFAIYVRFRRGLMKLAEYVEALAGVRA